MQRVYYNELLGIKRGFTCIIGGGGKTALLLRLGAELAASHKVILCATAKMIPPKGIPLLLSPSRADITRALFSHSLICVGDAVADGKLSLHQTPAAMLLEAAPYVLSEADGSKGLPLKAHAAYEPVLPEETARTVLVAGIDGIGLPIFAAAHRPELYAAILGKSEAQLVSPQDAAAVIKAEGFGDIVYLNKTETERQKAAAREMAADLDLPAVAGSLWEGVCWACSQ